MASSFFTKLEWYGWLYFVVKICFFFYSVYLNAAAAAAAYLAMLNKWNIYVQMCVSMRCCCWLILQTEMLYIQSYTYFYSKILYLKLTTHNKVAHSSGTHHGMSVKWKIGKWVRRGANVSLVIMTYTNTFNYELEEFSWRSLAVLLWWWVNCNFFFVYLMERYVEMMVVLVPRLCGIFFHIPAHICTFSQPFTT